MEPTYVHVWEDGTICDSCEKEGGFPLALALYWQGELSVGVLRVGTVLPPEGGR